MWDPIYPARTLVADIRAHVANWRKFEKAARTWPVISITTYVGRFFLIVSSAIVAIWYEESHNLTKGQGFLIFLLVIVPVVFVWFIVEHIAWNYDLRQKGISSSRDIWKVSQFPQP
jgi:membrane protein YdbS with pleckstrin-like domain